MGAVYEAFDRKLERRVAVKVIREDAGDAELRERFWREARAAAGISHPGVCQVFEIGDDAGVGLYIVMELLVGETLAARLAKGALGIPAAIRMATEISRTLSALHERGLIHRDLKPSNVFVLADGRTKLLDFGLVRAVTPPAGDDRTHPMLTLAGALVGTPAYMAPEQINGDPIDARADLFSLAAISWEMVAGRPAFGGRSVAETLASVLREEPRPLPESARAFERVVRRSLSKAPTLRHSSAAFFASELEAVGSAAPTASAASVLRPVTEVFPAPRATGGSLPVSRLSRETFSAPRRLVVLPLRMLRPDPELDFLGFALADAVSQSLSSLGSVVVRSTAAASAFAMSPNTDLGEIARKLDVDAVVIGTILASGGRCRVSAQLVEVPSGSVLCSTTGDGSTADVFDLQDDLARRVVEALRVPLSAGSSVAVGVDRPASPEAYELFLRANAAALEANDLSVARGLYRSCLENDPNFAPAWARLARVYRLQGKYSDERWEENFRAAEDALARALEINPDLGSAHLLHAGIDVDCGRSEAAVERLLALVERRPKDAEAWSGLVLSLRYLGLNEESIAADRRARSVDPNVVTSVAHSYIALGRYEEGLAAARRPGTWSATEASLCLWSLGRAEEGLPALREFVGKATGFVKRWAEMAIAIVEGDRATALALAESMAAFRDGEGQAYFTGIAAWAGGTSFALDRLERCAAAGYGNSPFLESWNAFEPIRGEARFVAALDRMRERHRSAAARFGGSVR